MPGCKISTRLPPYRTSSTPISIPTVCESANRHKGLVQRGFFEWPSRSCTSRRRGSGLQMPSESRASLLPNQIRTRPTIWPALSSLKRIGHRPQNKRWSPARPEPWISGSSCEFETDVYFAPGRYWPSRRPRWQTSPKRQSPTWRCHESARILHGFRRVATGWSWRTGWRCLMGQRRHSSQSQSSRVRGCQTSVWLPTPTQTQ